MSTSAHHRLAQYVDGDNPQRYRELVIHNLNSGVQKLSLVLNDTQFNSAEEDDKEYIVIPLGRAETVPADSPRPTKPEEFPNFTVPIVPKRYTTADFEKAQGKVNELRRGWLYIYRNGYLWRELQVVGSGFCKDVNLRRYQGQDTRKATGEADSRVIVPWKINNERQTVEIAYSEVQWSWARINALGGMDPDKVNEPRLKEGTPLAKLSESQTAENRKARMQDITDELEQWILDDGLADTENIQLPENVKADIYSLQLQKHSKMPVVFLQDPLGIVMDKAQAYQESLTKLSDLMETISQKPFYKSAVLAYKLFFDPKTAEQKHEGSSPEVHSTMDCHGRTGPTTTKTVFGKCGDKTDRAKLEELLEVTKRKELRAEIREKKDDLVEFLQGKHNGEAITKADFIDVNAAMVDFFSLEGYEYTQAWQAMLGLVANLNNAPCSVDNALTLSTDRDRRRYDDDPGCQYMEAMLKPDHPLHAMLFPTEEQAPVDSDAPGQTEDPENDGQGNFRPATFAAVLAGTLRTPKAISQESRRLSQFANASIQSLLEHFSAQYKKALESAANFDLKALTRLGKLTSDDLKGLRVFTNINGVPENYRVVDAGISKWRTLKAFETGKKSLNKARKGPNYFKILNGADELIATDNLTNLAKFKGVATQSGWSLNDLNKMRAGDLKIPPGAKVYSQSTHIIAIPESSPLVTKLNDIDAQVSKSVEIEAAALRALRKTLPAVVVLFEIWNLHSVMQTTGKSKIRGSAEFLNAVADLSYATLEGITTVLGKDHHISERLLKTTFRVGSKRLFALAAFGAATAFASAGLAFWDMLDELEEHDEDAAIGRGIAAAGFTLMGFALLGKAGVAMFAAFSPWLVAAAGLVLLATFIHAACNDTPLENWAGNGPFCDGDGDEDFQYLHNDPARAYTALAHCLFTPRVEIKRLSAPVFNESQKGDVKVTVHLPTFKEGQDEIDVRTYCEQAENISCITTKVETWAPRVPVEPFSVKQLDTDGQVTAMEYYYHGPGFPSDTPCRWATKARLFLAEGPTMLPDPASPTEDQTAILPEKPQPKEDETEADFQQRQKAFETQQTKQDADYNSRIPGWVYTGLD